VAIRIADVKRIVVVHRESGTHGEVKAAPLFDELAVLIPDLNARVIGMPVQDDEPAPGIHLDSMYCIEFAGLDTFDAADDLDELSILIKVDDAVILVTVGHEDIAVGRNENVTGAVE
jgi:hypothetical protein